MQKRPPDASFANANLNCFYGFSNYFFNFSHFFTIECVLVIMTWRFILHIFRCRGGRRKLISLNLGPDSKKPGASLAGPQSVRGIYFLFVMLVNFRCHSLKNSQYHSNLTSPVGWVGTEVFHAICDIITSIGILVDCNGNTFMTGIF